MTKYRKNGVCCYSSIFFDILPAKEQRLGGSDCGKGEAERGKGLFRRKSRVPDKTLKGLFLF